MNGFVVMSKLPYRNNVSCIVFKKNKFLLVQKNNWPENFWKFPQGGMEEGETYKQTAKRELTEELGTDKFRIIALSKYDNRFDWDDEAVRLAGYRWRGQIQKFFLIKFIGDNSDIDLDKDELRQYEWVSQDELYSHIDHDNKNFTNYKNIIEKIVEEFHKYFSK